MRRKVVFSFPLLLHLYVKIFNGIINDFESKSDLTYDKTMDEFVLREIPFFTIHFHVMILMFVWRVYCMLIGVTIGQMGVSLTLFMLYFSIYSQLWFSF